jgi:acyl-CoA synthetase (NDP forming)
LLDGASAIDRHYSRPDPRERSAAGDARCGKAFPIPHHQSNAVGLIVPTAKLNAGCAHMAAKPANAALLSQSGAIAASLIDWAAGNDVGFSHVISLGDMADVASATGWTCCS